MGNNALTIALAGNPNCGKTTIFNAITGSHQKVGNWAGVTVEKKEGRIHHEGWDVTVVDLPGTYSLTPFSIEEIVARNYILDARPDVVVNILDASNLERSLYLATQIRELDCPVLFVLNMADVARTKGIHIDADTLSALLALPVVFTVGNREEGVTDLLNAAISLAKTPDKTAKTRRVRYSADLEAAVDGIEGLLNEAAGAAFPYDLRWTAVKLLENDRLVKERVRQAVDAEKTSLFQDVKRVRQKLTALYDDEPEMVMTDERYGFIAGLMKETVSVSTRQRADISRSIDLILTNRYFGLPIFFFFIWMMFQLTFSLGQYPMDWIDSGVGFLSDFLSSHLAAGLFQEMLVDGVVAGVGGIIVFLPNILILFFCIALFEDTGYMARAAFLMDRIMHTIGLHGKSFIPMLMGFGCNVPAIMAARSLENEKDRILTILITPFMSCSARLPIYIILAGVFFPHHAGTVIFLLYLLGIFLAVLTGRLFRKTLLPGEDAPFVMELPPYRVPMLKSLLIHMWDRSRMFLKKMGGIILAGSILVWCLSAFPRNPVLSRDYDGEMVRVKAAWTEVVQEDPAAAEKLVLQLANLKSARKAEAIEVSYMGQIGNAIAPVFAPLGMDWRGSVAILTGFVAKEIVVSSMGILYGVDTEGGDQKALATALHNAGMTPLSAFSMMVFVLLYLPCLATILTIRSETGHGKWMWLSMGYTTGLAWLMAFLVFQGGRLLGLG